MCYNLSTKRGHASLILMLWGEKVNLNQVKEIVLDIIKDSEFTLYDIKEEKLGNDLILQIFIDKNPSITLDELAYLNEQISNKLDAIDSDYPPYYLEVSSPGAEKELRNLDEIKKYIGSYVYLEEDNNYYGYLEECSDEELVIKVNLKGRIKKQKVSLSKIKFIRLAVKV